MSNFTIRIVVLETRLQLGTVFAGEQDKRTASATTVDEEQMLSVRFFAGLFVPLCEPFKLSSGQVFVLPGAVQSHLRLPDSCHRCALLAARTHPPTEFRNATDTQGPCT